MYNDRKTFFSWFFKFNLSPMAEFPKEFQTVSYRTLVQTVGQFYFLVSFIIGFKIRDSDMTKL